MCMYVCMYIVSKTFVRFISLGHQMIATQVIRVFRHGRWQQVASGLTDPLHQQQVCRLLNSVMPQKICDASLFVSFCLPSV